VCYYLREVFKKNAKANFTNAGVGYIYEELEPIAPAIIASSRLIRKEVEKASKTNSRLAQCGKKKRVKAVDEEGLKGEVYGTVSLPGTGEGIGQGRNNPIHPLPDSQTGLPKHRLTGDRNQCAACLQYFNSITAFDKHRTGEFSEGRRCLTTDEMLAQHFGKTSDGFWLSPILPKDRERLATLRAGQKRQGEARTSQHFPAKASNALVMPDEEHCLIGGRGD
jgi:hypothetical protein